MLSISNAETLIHAFMTSRLDYCNALLGGCSACLINKLKKSFFLHSVTNGVLVPCRCRLWLA